MQKEAGSVPGSGTYQLKILKGAKDMEGCIENVIEFLLNEKRATVTFSQGRFKSRIRKLAKDYPEKCQIVAENKDGSICAHVPVDWVKISPLKKVSEAQRERAREQMQKYNSKYGSTPDGKG